MPRSRASMRPSVSTSARCRPPRSRSPSWARSRRSCVSPRSRGHEIRRGAGGRRRGLGRGPFDPPERPRVEEGHLDRQGRDRRAQSRRHHRDRGGADRTRRRLGGRSRGRDRGGGRGRRGARRAGLHRPRQPLCRDRRRAGGGQGCDRPPQPGRRVDHLRDAASLQAGGRGGDDRHRQNHSVRSRGQSARCGARGRQRRAPAGADRALPHSQDRRRLHAVAGPRRQGHRKDLKGHRGTPGPRGRQHRRGAARRA